MQRIWVVEDDMSIRELVLYALTASGFEASGFPDGGAFLSALGDAMPDLVLLDIMLPGMDGIEILGSLKQSARTKKLPVILLTAKSAELDRVRGLDLGADDYIVKPFSVLELSSRIRAVLRRAQPEAPAAALRCGGIELDPERRHVAANGREVDLTFKEFELLMLLMLNRGIVMSRQKILEQVWGFDYEGESRTIDMHVLTLRQKLGDAGVLIKTVRNVGYKIGENA